ncbi:hypothetical protein [Photorhabdus sp. RM96S]|uniref:hypothetical protein n=1 Tax=Photorhabdus sp. RM96S TaxID=3342822 RepID=UPI0036DBB709
MLFYSIFSLKQQKAGIASGWLLSYRGECHANADGLVQSQGIKVITDILMQCSG